MSVIEVLSIASEVYPLVKTGGLADVAGAVPAALRTEDVRMRTLVPGYPAVLAALEGAEEIYVFPHLFGSYGRLLAGRAAGLDLFVLDAPAFYDRPGNPYQAPGGEPWGDNPFRFAALARIGASLGAGLLLPGYTPQVIQAHDWQAGLAPAYIHYDGRGPKTVMTVHNLAYQGQFDPRLLTALGLPPGALTIHGVEYYGGIGFLKAGLKLADRITTVSPSYAVEIQTDEGGMGLGGLLRDRANVLSGILNGLDDEVWNPARDFLLAAPFSRKQMGPRAKNKAALRLRLGLAPESPGPLFGIVGRLNWHKGSDLLLGALPVLLSQGAQFALLGSGEGGLEAGFRAAAAGNPGRVACHIGYEEKLAHQMQGGVDALLVPSRSEPCGLTQLCALRYGALPVVARVGGLSDTVIDANPMAVTQGQGTGVQFAPGTVAMLGGAIRRTIDLYREPKLWQKLQANGMACDVSWREPARRYARLFRTLAAESGRG
jgi:starch synthase